MKCFYHLADFDGLCSGSIVKHAYPECEMIGINYGEEFPWETISPQEEVFMVDFSLQPFEEMIRLVNQCQLTWIDHHKTALDEAARYKHNFLCNGIRKIGIGACALTWQFLQASRLEDPLPLAVKLLAEYDVWDHHDSQTLPFQYGMRLVENTPPDNQMFWETLFYDELFVNDVINDGELVLKYEVQQNKKVCQAYAFETTLVPPFVMSSETSLKLPPYTAICCNRGCTNSKLFDSVYDPERYDVMITFCRLKPPAHQWTVSLYSTRDDVDCGAIAKGFDGGGHKGAAGFQCKELPFDY